MRRSATPLVLALTLALPLRSAAQEPARVSSTPLALERVLESTRQHHPLIAAERLSVRAADGDALAARGEFDTTVTVTGRAAPVGYYDVRRADVVLEQPLPVLGASVYTGYRVMRGRVAPYYGEQTTLRGGELRAGMKLPLLQDLQLDGRRAGVQASQAQLRAETAAYNEMLLDLECDAAEAYIGWVAAGRRLAELQQLVALGLQRDEQIRSKVTLGAIPAIEQVDNSRSLLDRQRLLTMARRTFEKASIGLSLFVRDPQGVARVPAHAELPSEPLLPTPTPAELSHAERSAIERRPRLQLYAASMEVARVESSLAENRVLPRVDAVAEVSKDLGTGPTELEKSLGPAVVEVGVSFSMPLWMRKANGKLQAAAAKLEAAQKKLDFAQDKLIAEVRDAWSQHRAAQERSELASASASAAEKVAQGERDRFELGATTVLFVNLREQAATDARLAYIDAVAELQYSAARLVTLTGQSLSE
jgi:outer membrane protein, heavy metal efflux system